MVIGSQMNQWHFSAFQFVGGLWINYDVQVKSQIRPRLSFDAVKSHLHLCECGCIYVIHQPNIKYGIHIIHKFTWSQFYRTRTEWSEAKLFKFTWWIKFLSIFTHRNQFLPLPIVCSFNHSFTHSQCISKFKYFPFGNLAYYMNKYESLFMYAKVPIYITICREFDSEVDDVVLSVVSDSLHAHSIIFFLWNVNRHFAYFVRSMAT